jgi:hypothetical protein
VHQGDRETKGGGLEVIEDGGVLPQVAHMLEVIEDSGMLPWVARGLQVIEDDSMLEVDSGVLRGQSRG